MHRPLTLLLVLAALQPAAALAQTTKTVSIAIKADGTCHAGKIDAPCREIGQKLREAGFPPGTHVRFTGSGDGKVSYDLMRTAVVSLGHVGFKFGYVNVAPTDNRCSGLRVSEVRSLAALPDGLRELLPSGANGIADRGGRFNVSDALIPETAPLPMRRFTLAAVGATCAVVAVEYGGRAHGFEVLEYHLINGIWRSAGRTALFREPNSVSDLLRVEGSAK